MERSHINYLYMYILCQDWIGSEGCVYVCVCVGSSWLSGEGIHSNSENSSKSFDGRNLRRVAEVTKAFCWNQNFVFKKMRSQMNQTFVLNESSALTQGIYTCMKS